MVIDRQSHVNGSAIVYHYLLWRPNGFHCVGRRQIWGHEICPGRQIPDSEVAAIVYLHRIALTDRGNFSHTYVQPGITRQVAVDNLHRALDGRRAVSNNQAHSSDLLVSVDRYSIRWRCLWILDARQTKARFLMVELSNTEPAFRPLIEKL